jgi:hypothetical protein
MLNRIAPQAALLQEFVEVAGFHTNLTDRPWSGRDTAFYEFKTQFTAGRAVHVGLRGSVALCGM